MDVNIVTELLKKKKSSFPSPISILKLVLDTFMLKTNPIKRVSIWIELQKYRKVIKQINYKDVFKSDDEYLEYIKLQLKHASLKLVTKDVSWKHKIIMPKVNNFFTKKRVAFQDLSVLCIGCRSTQELESFDNLGFGIVKGIDIFSIHERIELMDMHALKYSDNSFNCIYMADVIEHSYDINKVISEVIRVCKTNALICILAPFNFQVNSRRHFTDFESPEKLISMFRGVVNEIVYKELRIFKKITDGKEIEQEELILLFSIN